MEPGISMTDHQRGAEAERAAKNPWARQRRDDQFGVLTCFGASDDRRSVMVRYKGAMGVVKSVKEWERLPLTAPNGVHHRKADHADD